MNQTHIKLWLIAIRLWLIAVTVATIWLVISLLSAHAQTPLQAQSRLDTNAVATGPVRDGVLEGSTNVVPVQEWTVQVIETIVILRSQRTELRVSLPIPPLLSATTNVPATRPVTNNVDFIGPVEPPKTPRRKPRT